IAIIALYLLHQDFWFWRATAPIIFGFLPIGLFYHICYTLAISALMWLLVRQAWPSHLEEGRGDREIGGGREGGTEGRGGGERGREGEEEILAPRVSRPVSPSQIEEARRL